MSADAKAWTEEDGSWRALHDGPCRQAAAHVEATSYDLVAVLTSVETCVGHSLRWEFRSYPDGLIGLVGYEA